VAHDRPDDPTGGYGSYEPPPDGWGGEDAAVSWPGDSPPEDRALTEGGFSPALLDAREKLAEALRAQGDSRREARRPEDFTGMLNVQGVGIGVAAPSNGSYQGAEPGRPALMVHLVEARAVDEVRSLLVDEMSVPEVESDEFDIVPEVTGVIEPLSHTFILRPAPGGISALNGNVPNFVGTMGCLVTGRQPPRNERVLILSNNHVFARENQGVTGECICQPSPGDFGSCPDHQVAQLEQFIPLSFGGGAVNYVDCACAWAWPDRVRREMLYLAPEGPAFFSVSSRPAMAYRGMQVGKSGRTTQLTNGYVEEVGVVDWISYGLGQAYFAGMLKIRATSGLFSSGGDSGSLVWTWDVNRSPVALLFAGNAALGYTLANPIEFVLNALDCDILA
jgi:hypothetical protein